MHSVVLDPDYQFNEEKPIEMVPRLADRFKNSGLVMPATQRTIYEKLTEKIVVNDKGSVKKTVCDVGCGLGIGANILSKEARFVWGVDISEDNVSFARQMYGSDPRLRFDAFDVRDYPREVAKFDVVSCVEVLEHCVDPEKVIAFIKRIMHPYPRSVAWITLPNRNSPLLQKDKPKNEFHIGEPNAAELYAFLEKHFEFIVLFGPDLETTHDLDTEVTPLVVKAENPK